jgi:ribosomal protein S27AE
MINDIDRLSYEQETERLRQKDEILNSKIKADNFLIQEYNDKVAFVITEIKLLDKWEDSIEFEGQSYGIPNVYEKRHRYKNCNGTMLLKHKIRHQCGKCEYGMWGCGGGCGSWEEVYKCSNCGFGYSC